MKDSTSYTFTRSSVLSKSRVLDWRQNNETTAYDECTWAVPIVTGRGAKGNTES